MNKLIIFTALLGCAAAAPGLYVTHETHEPVVHSITSPSKTTVTKNSLSINHGGHDIVHVPVHQEVHALVHEPVHTLVHEPVHTLVHEPVHTLVHEPVHALVHEPVQIKEPAKSSQYFKMENTVYKTSKVVPFHTKVVAPVISYEHAPVVQTPVYHSLVHSPVVSRTGDSAVSHQSSTSHETVHEVKHLPLYTLHH